MKQTYHTMKHFFIIVNQQLAYFCKDESISSTNNKFKCYEGN